MALAYSHLTVSSVCTIEERMRGIRYSVYSKTQHRGMTVGEVHAKSEMPRDVRERESECILY
jgi:hypothetical protein